VEKLANEMIMTPELLAQTLTHEAKDRMGDDMVWALKSPEFIFNITGTANPQMSEQQQQQSFPLSETDPIKLFKRDWPQLWYYKRLKNFFTEVVFGVAHEKRSCWMMDGGTNVGIMRLLGSMHREHFHDNVIHGPANFPLIGFSDLSTLDLAMLRNFSQLDHSHYLPIREDRNVLRDPKRYQPDPDHTHHVHVHSAGLKCGSVAGVPHEHHFLLLFYRHLAVLFPQCPIVCRPVTRCFYFF
jgi:hypothetical protein